MVGISSLGSATAENTANTDASGAKQAVGYIARSRKMIPFSELFPRVMRYYSLCLLPISLAVSSILARLIRLLRRFKSPQNLQKRIDDRFVLLLAAWWILDMVFVWISPRSYEQYYLPLNASAAMLSGYIITLYADKFNKSQFIINLLTFRT